MTVGREDWMLRGGSVGEDAPPENEQPAPAPRVRTFETGATRDIDTGKPDYEGYLSPLVLVRFGQYMTKHRVQSDGSLRDSDNWQKGIPLTAYIKSLWRHLVDTWRLHRGLPTYDVKNQPVDIEDALCGIIFNAQGYLHEYLKGSKLREDIPMATTPQTPPWWSKMTASERAAAFEEQPPRDLMDAVERARERAARERTVRRG